MDIKRKKKKNKKLTAAIIGLFILIPALVTLYVVFKTYPGDLRASAIGKISITSPEGISFEYSDEDSLKFFSEMYNSASEIETPAHDRNEYKEFNMTVDRTADDILCDILLTDAPEDCLLRFVSDGKSVYKNIFPEHASVLLSDENFATAYTYYMPPKLEITVNESVQSISPVQIEWQYRKSDGNFYPTDTTDFVAKEPTAFDYKPDKYISLSFELAPDLLSVQIFDGEDPIFSDKYDSQNYRSFTYNKKADLKYIFTAEWIATSSARYHGKAVYELDVKYIVQPVGIASNAKITQGEFLAYTIYNTADGEILTVNDEQKLQLFAHNDAKLLFYPSYPGGFVGQKTLSITDSDGNTVSEFIEVSLPEETTETYELHESLPKELYIADYSDNTSAVSNLRMYTVSATPKLWEGAFIDPADGMNVTLKYGTTITSGDESIGKASFMLINASTDNIKAIGNGKVAFAGELDTFGKTIIIDHGLGICSFYSNLEEIHFSQGDTVTKGLTVATINSAGYALLYGVSVNGYFINPSSLNSCLEPALLV